MFIEEYVRIEALKIDIPFKVDFIYGLANNRYTIHGIRTILNDMVEEGLLSVRVAEEESGKPHYFSVLNPPVPTTRVVMTIPNSMIKAVNKMLDKGITDLFLARAQVDQVIEFRRLFEEQLPVEEQSNG